MGNWILRGDFGTAPDDLRGMLLGLMLAFLCGHVVAWVYMVCHNGLSYSRSFVNSLIVLCIIVAVVMMVMANNLLIAFGLMAVFAIVRFRNILRDTLDTTYILSSITMGMACGTKKYSTAILGTGIFSLLMLYLHWTQFGTRHRFELLLFLERHSRRAQIASQRSASISEGTDLSYRLLLRDAGRVDELITELKAFPGVTRVTSLKAEEESEV
jgi:hypothetical protein